MSSKLCSMMLHWPSIFDFFPNDKEPENMDALLEKAWLHWLSATSVIIIIIIVFHLGTDSQGSQNGKIRKKPM